jgi:hypothetical protein
VNGLSSLGLSISSYSETRSQGRDSAPNESSGIVKKVLQRKRPEPPDELQDDEEGYVLISWGDLTPAMAYLHASGPKNNQKCGSTRKSVAQTRPIIKQSMPPLSWAIRNTKLSFEEVISEVEA